MALKKTPNPKYKQTVEIPAFGDKPEKVDFWFKYKTEEEFKAMKEAQGENGLLVDFLPLLIDSWGFGASDAFGEFSPEAFKEMANVYPGAPNAIHIAYLTGRYQGRLGN